MIKPLYKIYPVYVFVDLILISISFILPYIIRYNQLTNVFSGFHLPNFEIYSSIFILWAIFIMIIFKGRRLYATDRSLSIPRELFRVIGSIFYTSVLIAAIIFFAKYKDFSRSVFLGNFLMLCILLGGYRVIKRVVLRKMILRGFHNINVLVVGGGKIGKTILDEVKKSPWLGLRVVGILDDNLEGKIEGVPILGELRDFSDVVKKFFVDEVIVTIPSERESISELIQKAKNLLLGIRVVPQDFEQSLSTPELNYLGLVPLISYKIRTHHPADFIAKRAFDFLISLALLILLFPLMLAIAIFIKLDSKGPVFYIQKRSGVKGRVFNFYKFRSMVADAEILKLDLIDKNEVKDGIIFKIKEDPRITKIGRFLRKYSLDELPQFFNVLKGDMSLVGPRPPTPDEVEKYSHHDMQRLSIRPGITGLSQIRGRSELTFKKWVRWDFWYINNWSFNLDLQILLWTIPAVLKGKGAY